MFVLFLQLKNVLKTIYLKLKKHSNVVGTGKSTEKKLENAGMYIHNMPNNEAAVKTGMTVLFLTVFRRHFCSGFWKKRGNDDRFAPDVICQPSKAKLLAAHS